MKTFLLTLLLCLMFPLVLEAAFSKSDSGTKAAAFLKMPVGARAIGMGNAYTSVVNAASDMMYWNPAGIASLVKKDISFMYSSSFEDVAYEWASFALPTEYGVFGIAMQHLSYGDIDELDGIGNATGTSFSPYDLAIYLSYARSAFFDNYGILDYGVNFKYIYSKIENSASAAAFDAGAIYTLNDETTSIGLVVQNVGTSIKYNNDSEKLPVMFKAGASKLFFDALLLSADINFPSDNDIFPGIGAEYALKVNEEAQISLRAGYDGRQKDIPGTGGINAGFGVKFRDYVFDYAFSPSGDIGDAHRASLGIKFGYDITEEKPEKEIKEKPKKSAKENISMKPSEPESSASAPKAAGEEKSVYKMPPDEDDEESDDYERYGFRADAYEKENEDTRINENAAVVAVMDFYSGNLAASEVKAFSQMLRKAVTESGELRALGKLEIQQDSPAGGALNENASKKILKDSAADILISGTVEKRSGKLHFDINVYEKNKQARNYKIIAEDSFRDAQKKFGSFAETLKEAAR